MMASSNPDQPDLLLGVDAGTSVVKAALFDGDGQELIVTQQRTTLRAPQPGWSETDMDETWAMACAAIRTLLSAENGLAQRVAAVGVTGNMVGAWLVDATGRPLRNAILWNDGRTQPLIDRLSREHQGFMSTIFQASGSVMQQGCTLPLLRWLADHEPVSLERAQSLLCCKDWIVYKLTGALQIDPTEASVMPGDARRRGYSEPMIDLFGLRAYRRLFPPIKASDSVVATVAANAAAETGLPVGTPVVAGAGDVPASAIGLGAVTPGSACTLLGTNILNCVVSEEATFEPIDTGLLFCLPGKRWLRAMVNVSGTTSLDWFVEQFCGAEMAASESDRDLYAALEDLARSSPVGANGVIYLPYLSTLGITTPYLEPSARAEFFGLTDEHRRADLLRALYEGIALSIRDGYETMARQVEEIRLAGGGARSAFWCQIIADCTKRPVVVPPGSEFGARGAALLAAAGINQYNTTEAATDMVKGQVFRPRAEAAAHYEDVYGTYCMLRDDLRRSWRNADERLPA